MRYWIALLLAMFAACEGWAVPIDWLDEVTLGASVGYREDSLDWNISGGHHGPNILSELEWRNLRMAQIGISGNVVTWGCWVIKGEADYAKFFTGRTQDSDYLKNDRHGEISRFDCNANKGEAFDISGGLGFNYCWPWEAEFMFTPLIGYSLHEQHLRMFDGDVSVFNGRSVNAHLRNLHSNYRTHWFGPWAGLDLAYAYSCNLEFNASLEYHWLYYRATGHWNLREEFYDDFQHTSNGSGILGSFGGTYCLGEGWKTGLNIVYLNFRGRGGRDRTFIEEVIFEDSDSRSPYKQKIIAETKINEVNWHSFRLVADVIYEF